jgi:hypothetical protein
MNLCDMNLIIHVLDLVAHRLYFKGYFDGGMECITSEIPDDYVWICPSTVQ